LERRSAVVAAWEGLIESVRPSPEAIRAYAASPMLRGPDLSDRFLELCGSASSTPAVNADAEELIWTDTSPWPIAFGGFFGQMATIAHGFQLLMERRVAEIPFGNVLSEYPRLMPTRFHYAAASLGAWAGGAVNVQYFAQFASAPQVADPDINRRYARQLGYDEEAAGALTESGVVAIPSNLASPLMSAEEAPEDVRVFGSISIDEFNPANKPAVPFGPLVKPGGLILDTYYRAPFLSRKLDGDALYGDRDVLRDHYEDFYNSLEIESLVRCKHYCAPVVAVSSLDDIRQIVGRVPKRSESGLRFRGQSRLYHLQRADQVKDFLFGGSASTEPSLTTSAARVGRDYDRSHFLLRRFLGERIFVRSEALGDDHLALRWSEALRSGGCELDNALVALAQHYGLPSHGLDVSRDPDVAVWFATHALSVDAGAAAVYRPRAEAGWSTGVDDCPVILVHQLVTHSIAASLQDCAPLGEFGFMAERPVRQEAQFFHGAHSDHRNRLAESLVCVLRLEEGDYSTGHTFDKLFPSPDVDEGYRIMLDFSAWAGADDYPVLRFQ
jgi:hypothetical protein